MGGAASTTHDSTPTTLKRAVFVCHSSQEPELRRRLAGSAWCVREASSPTLSAVAVVTERYPRDTQARAELLTRAQVAVLAVDAAFQQAPALVAAVSFLKDSRKEVVAGPLTFHSRPSGAVGAVCFAFGAWMPELFFAPRQESGGCEADGVGAIRRSGATTLSFLSQDEAATVVAVASASESELDAIDASEHVAVALQAAATDAPDASPRRLLFVFAGADGERVARAFATLTYDSATTVVECCTQTLDCDLATLARAHTAAFVITDACMGTDRPSAQYFRRLLEAAIRWRTPALPINAATVRISDGGGWLALAMAGKLWYQVALDSLELIHTKYADIPGCACKVDDSCLANDFLQCLDGLLAKSAAAALAATATTPSTLDSVDDGREREAALIACCRERARVGGGLSADHVDALCAAVCDLVARYDADPDSATARQQLEALGIAMDPCAFAQQVADEERDVHAHTPSPTQLLPAAPENDQLSLATVHYKVTRTGHAPLPSVLDARGLPLVNLQLDAMFSYQWSAQQAVLDVHQQGYVHRLRAWLDVFGHIQGNVNAAMATAVENVACVVVFLTRAYVQSVNCRLEFQYARTCGTPLLFAFLEDPRVLAAELPDWVVDAVGGRSFSVLPTLRRDNDGSANDNNNDSRVLALDLTTDDKIHGASTLAVLFSAIRQLAAARYRRGAPRTAYDGSLLLYATTRALRYAVQRQDGADMSLSRLTCTRCGAAFDPATPASVDGCRRHAAYYVGGTLIAGRWACCEEQARDGAGCEPAQHTAESRTWTLDPLFGTYSWQPA